eukprot:Ihof_evm16s109 gene=Ihof_evmTU16s109
MSSTQEGQDLPCVRGKDYSLVLGDSFRNRRFPYHYSHYDFKPAKANELLPGSMVYSDREVTLALPSNMSEEEEVAFKGPCTAQRRECILVFDPNTETFTLEKLTSSCRLKADRNPSRLLLPKAPAPILSPASPVEGSSSDQNGESGDSSDSDGSSSFSDSNSSSSYTSSSSEDEMEEDNPTKRPRPFPTPSPPAPEMAVKDNLVRQSPLTASQP